jgi:hypothetical protein
MAALIQASSTMFRLIRKHSLARTDVRALFLLPLTLLISSIGASQPQPADGWADWNFLMGEWLTGNGTGTPGTTGTGWFTLDRALDGRVLLRKNHAEYPPHKGRPGAVHDDLTIIYREAGFAKALYSDNEGRVIHYEVEFSPDKKKIIFISEKNVISRRYRLTYELVQPDLIKLVFETARQDNPEQFALYVEALAHRKSASAVPTIPQDSSQPSSLHKGTAKTSPQIR